MRLWSPKQTMMVVGIWSPSSSSCFCNLLLRADCLPLHQLARVATHAIPRPIAYGCGSEEGSMFFRRAVRMLAISVASGEAMTHVITPSIHSKFPGRTRETDRHTGHSRGP